MPARKRRAVRNSAKLEDHVNRPAADLTADGTAQAGTNVTYELHTLGWAQFQDLCAAVLRTVLGQDVETFSKTNDGGQDGTFCGEWNAENLGVSGSGTMQCKFSAVRDSKLRLSDLTDELKKARKLAKAGRAKTYILVTNVSVTAKTRTAIENKFASIEGVDVFLLRGREWITEQITSSDHLRMLVPRVYGLGDLTQILDQRRRLQARAILDAHDDNIKTFVITKAHHDSVKAISDGGFVMLLGDPATGKTSIATALALGSIDRWHCVPTKVTNAQEFRDAWNPPERQFFWIDDAFGTVQYQSRYADEWVRTFPFIQNALKGGTKIVFTSRTYIYNAALHDLKTSEFSILRNSKVIIQVERYTKLEREGILYNHLRFGDQSEAYKQRLHDNGLLDQIVAHERFTPVVARRLSAVMYTKRLQLTSEVIDHFIENQGDYVRDVIEELDRPSYAGLSFIFMSGGTLKAPIPHEPRYRKTARSLNTDIGATSAALQAMNKGLVRLQPDGGNFVWRFDHPSIGDALATILTANIEQLDIYLQGTRPEQIAQEVTCIGKQMRGAVRVPHSQYELLLKRLQLLPRNPVGVEQLQTFLLDRADAEFLRTYLKSDPDLTRRLISFAGYAFTVESRLFARMHQLKLVREDDRVAAVASIKRAAVTSLNIDFLEGTMKEMLTDQERDDILEAVRGQALPNLQSIIEDIEENYESPDDPEEHFSELRSRLEELHTIYEDDPRATRMIEDAIDEIEERAQLLEAELPERSNEDDDRDDDDLEPLVAATDGDRDFFSDVYVPV